MREEKEKGRRECARAARARTEEGLRVAFLAVKAAERLRATSMVNWGAVARSPCWSLGERRKTIVRCLSESFPELVNVGQGCWWEMLIDKIISCFGDGRCKESVTTRIQTWELRNGIIKG